MKKWKKLKKSIRDQLMKYDSQTGKGERRLAERSAARAARGFPDLTSQPRGGSFYRLGDLTKFGSSQVEKQGIFEGVPVSWAPRWMGR